MAKYRIVQEGDTFYPQRREFVLFWFLWLNLAYSTTQRDAERVIEARMKKDEDYENRKIVKTY